MAFHGTPGWDSAYGRQTYTIEAVDFETDQKFEVLLEKRHDGAGRYLSVKFPDRKVVFERDAIEDLKIFLEN